MKIDEKASIKEFAPKSKNISVMDGIVDLVKRHPFILSLIAIEKINIRDNIQYPIFPHYWHYELKDRKTNIDKQRKQVYATYITIKILQKLYLRTFPFVRLNDLLGAIIHCEAELI